MVSELKFNMKLMVTIFNLRLPSHDLILAAVRFPERVTEM